MKMSEAVDDMYAFTHLTDSVLQIIKLYPEEALYLLVKDIDDVEEREVNVYVLCILAHDSMMTSSNPHSLTYIATTVQWCEVNYVSMCYLFY